MPSWTFLWSWAGGPLGPADAGPLPALGRHGVKVAHCGDNMTLPHGPGRGNVTDSGTVAMSPQLLGSILESFDPGPGPCRANHGHSVTDLTQSRVGSGPGSAAVGQGSQVSYARGLRLRQRLPLPARGRIP